MRRSGIFVEDILPNCNYHVAARTQQEKVCVPVYPIYTVYRIHSTLEIAVLVTLNRTLAFSPNVSLIQTCVTNVVVYTALRHKQ